MSRIQKALKSKKDKERRASRGPDDIRRDFDLHNAARLTASQLSQSSELDISTYQPPPAPNISVSSSSSSSAAFNNNDPLYDKMKITDQRLILQ